MKKSKKIIIVFLILLLAILVSVAIIYKYKSANTKEEFSIYNEEENKTTNNIESAENVLVQNTLASLEIKEQNIINAEEKEIVNTNNVEKNNTTNQKQKKSPVKSEKKETPVATSKEVVSTQPVSISKPVEEPKVETQPIPEVPKSPVVQETVVAPTVPTEEYRYNDAMTQTIVNIINSNPSQYMQTDGYNVVVDSSITSLTNQFTFTQERVINKIANKAGTIKVYAQDYYCNGELLFTECYIF